MENKPEEQVNYLFHHLKGSGSPLGMLFDHGVDSLSSFMITLQMLEIFRINNQDIIVLSLFVFIMTVFFSALWNQYSTGVFKLGRINPVD
jgi:ethanolaminephosphotransferase